MKRFGDQIIGLAWGSQDAMFWLKKYIKIYL